MAAWLAPVEVLAFASAEEYGRACEAQPSLRAHLLMHCDAAEGADDSDSEDSEEGGDERGKSGKPSPAPHSPRHSFLVHLEDRNSPGAPNMSLSRPKISVHH